MALIQEEIFSRRLGFLAGRASRSTTPTKAKMSASVAASVSISSAAALRAGRAQKRATVAKAARADANNEVRHRGISTDWTLSVVIHFPRPRGSEPIV